MKNNIYITETRKCKDCKHFKKDRFPICPKLRMRITGDLKITYVAEKGTCFENT